jgi:hypothetical protein
LCCGIAPSLFGDSVWRFLRGNSILLWLAGQMLTNISQKRAKVGRL